MIVSFFAGYIPIPIPIISTNQDAPAEAPCPGVQKTSSGGVPSTENGDITGISFDIPSGKPLHNNGKSPFLMGKLNYFDWAIFNSKLLVITRG